jgi:tetratricopeptide (TPR) repeat protein
MPSGGAGRARLELGEPERALAHFERALALYPWDDESRQGRARARRELAARRAGD